MPSTPQFELRQLCSCGNRGLYVKLAQALATQGPFLPAPYMRLGKLLDDAEHFDYETVRRVSFLTPLSFQS